jgi:hypothetical protein
MLGTWGPEGLKCFLSLPFSHHHPVAAFPAAGMKIPSGVETLAFCLGVPGAQAEGALKILFSAISTAN